MDTAALTRLALGAGVLYAIWKFAPSPEIKVMALGAAGVIAARRLPYVSPLLTA